MQAEQIAKQLGNAKKANGQWVASCPVPGHGKGNGDKNPSLSISINDDGKPLFHCHGGCTQEDVFNTIKDMRLLPELEERPDPLANIKPLPQIKFDQEWEYQDEDRTTVFVKQRMKIGESGKTYRLYKVDPDGRRHPTLGDARIVPYKLPELLDAKTAGRIIYVVEGEKAADALISIGVTATTAHTGAGSWPEAITEYFAGANVVIVPDNDLPGWRYAQKAVEAILPIAKNVKVVDLQLPNTADDAYEFVHQYNKQRDDLVALVKAAFKVTSIDDVTVPERLNALKLDAPSSTKNSEIYTHDADHVKKQAEIEHAFAGEPSTKQTQAKEAKPPKTVNIEAWDDIQDEPVEWLIHGILPSKSFSALFGPPGSFKSFIALDMAEAIATGRPWMGNQIEQQGAVLYICGEGFGGMGARIKACQIHHSTPKGAPIYVIRHQLNLRSSAEDFNALMMAVVQLVETTGIEFQLLIIDTLARAFGGGNENDSDAMGSFITSMGKIQEFLACALMVLHHSGKDLAKGLRGHSSLLGAVDTQLEILRFEDQAKGIISLTKQKDGQDGIRIGFEMVEIEISSSSLGFDPVVSLAVQASDEAVNEMSRKASKGNQDNKGNGKNQRLEMLCLETVVRSKGIIKFVDKKQRMAVNLEEWRQELWEKMGCTDEDKNTFKTAWSRAKTRLQDAGLIGIRDKLVWLESKDQSEDEY
jgi:hypothetical protein